MRPGQGVLSVFDPPRHDTKETIAAAFENGVEVKMITGDQTAIAVETCRMLGMGTKVRFVLVASYAAGCCCGMVCAVLIVVALLLQILNTDALNAGSSNYGSSLGDVILQANGFAEVYPEHKFQSMCRDVEVVTHRRIAVTDVGACTARCWRCSC